MQLKLALLNPGCMKKLLGSLKQNTQAWASPSEEHPDVIGLGISILFSLSKLCVSLKCSRVKSLLF